MFFVSNPKRGTKTARQTASDEAKIAKIAKSMKDRFDAVRTLPQVSKAAEDARQQFPSKSKDDIKARTRAMRESIAKIKQAAKLLDAAEKDGAKRSSFIDNIAKLTLGQKTLSSAKAAIDRMARNSYRGEVRSEAADVFKSRGYSDAILSLLPQGLAVNVDEDGVVQEFYDRLANEHKGTREKIEEFGRLVAQKADIIEQAEADVANGEQPEYFGGLVTLILVETGMRPSSQGAVFGEYVLDDEKKRVMVKTIVDGKEVERPKKEDVSVYGAVSLMHEHITIDGQTVTFAFQGKENVPNRYSTSRPSIVRSIKSIVGKLTAGGRSKKRGPLFAFDTPMPVAEGGKLYSAYDKNFLDAYLEKNFDGVNANNFRKYVGTSKMWESIQQQQESLLRKIASFKKMAKDQAAEAVVRAIVETFSEAVKTGATALSHKQKKREDAGVEEPKRKRKPKTPEEMTTAELAIANRQLADTFIDAYLNPQVIAFWLSTARADIDVDAIVKGEIVVNFDPAHWIEIADEAVRSGKIKQLGKTKKNGGESSLLDLEKSIMESSDEADQIHDADVKMSVG